jgi:hypothetical protein
MSSFNPVNTSPQAPTPEPKSAADEGPLPDADSHLTPDERRTLIRRSIDALGTDPVRYSEESLPQANGLGNAAASEREIDAPNGTDQHTNRQITGEGYNAAGNEDGVAAESDAANHAGDDDDFDPDESPPTEPPSLAEEARQAGWWDDYHASMPFGSLGLPIPSEVAFEEITEPALEAAVEVCHNPCGWEKWEVDKDTASFLASVMALGNSGAEPPEDGHVTFADLKLTEPIVKQDPELELQRVKRRNVAVISSRGMEPFPINVGKGEGWEWPPEVCEAANQRQVEVASEKLEVEAQVLDYLRSIITSEELSTGGLLATLVDQDKVSGSALLSALLLTHTPASYTMSRNAPVDAFVTFVHSRATPSLITAGGVHIYSRGPDGCGSSAYRSIHKTTR